MRARVKRKFRKVRDEHMNTKGMPKGQQKPKKKVK